jgi:anti-sigma factor RsiW
MTPEWATHLSDEALDDVLIGLGSEETETHLFSCPDCRARVAAFRADMSFFNSASIAWSESKKQRFRWTPPRPTGFRIRVAFVSWAAVAVALLVMAVVIGRHGPPAQPNHAYHVEVAQPVDSEAQIAQDNQLLQAVNAAIGPDEESPIDEYKISDRPHSHLKAHPR